MGQEICLAARQTHTADRQQSYHAFRARFVRAAAAVGIEDVAPHDLRATHGSWVADSHGVMVAAYRLGHANASVTTRHYARAIDGRDAEVAKHLDKVGKPAAKPSGTARARKIREESGYGFDRYESSRDDATIRPFGTKK
jgi:hypothetical protein